MSYWFSVRTFSLRFNNSVVKCAIYFILLAFLYFVSIVINNLVEILLYFCILCVLAKLYVVRGSL